MTELIIETTRSLRRRSTPSERKLPKLVIEIDGGVHARRKDYACRTCIIEQPGMKVIRFTNDEVKFQIEGVVQKLKNTSPLDPLS